MKRRQPVLPIIQPGQRLVDSDLPPEVIVNAVRWYLRIGLPYRDHGRLKAKLRRMRGLKWERTANVVIRGHAFIQNLRRGHYELVVDALPGLAVAGAFDALELVV